MPITFLQSVGLAHVAEVTFSRPAEVEFPAEVLKTNGCLFRMFYDRAWPSGTLQIFSSLNSLLASATFLRSGFMPLHADRSVEEAVDRVVSTAYTVWQIVPKDWKGPRMGDRQWFKTSN